MYIENENNNQPINLDNTTSTQTNTNIYTDIESSIENLFQNLDSIYNENNVESQTENNEKIIEENNISNCLALTIKEDYKLTSKTNRILRSLRMSFKVFVSTLTLNIIKFFF